MAKSIDPKRRAAKKVKTKSGKTKEIKDKTDKEGRPLIDLGADDLNQIARCVQQHCTQEETAAIIGISVDTLSRRLADIGSSWTLFSAQHMAAGRASLRRTLWHHADENPRSAEWLSKQYLGMKERTEVGFDPEKPAKFVLNMGKNLGEKKDDTDL